MHIQHVTGTGFLVMRRTCASFASLQDHEPYTDLTVWVCRRIPG